MIGETNNGSPRKGENDPRKQSEQSDNEFPGYPHYPSKDDIMSSSSEMKRVEVDIENISPSGKFMNTKDSKNPMSNPPASETSAASGDDELQIVPGTEADVTKDDLAVLGGRKFKDEDLQGGKRNTMVTGDDLDIPGTELDNSNESIGEEDEENNYYSLGGDRHEDLEEDRSV